MQGQRDAGAHQCTLFSVRSVAPICLLVSQHCTAAQVSPDCSHHTSTVCCAGYIAPEVIRGIMQPSGDPVKEGCEDPNHHYGPPCDLWSAGIVLYMLLSGERSGNRCSAGW